MGRRPRRVWAGEESNLYHQCFLGEAGEELYRTAECGIILKIAIQKILGKALDNISISCAEENKFVSAQVNVCGQLLSRSQCGRFVVVSHDSFSARQEEPVVANWRHSSGDGAQQNLSPDLSQEITNE